MVGKESGSGINSIRPIYLQAIKEIGSRAFGSFMRLQFSSFVALVVVVVGCYCKEVIVII